MYHILNINSNIVLIINYNFSYDLQKIWQGVFLWSEQIRRFTIHCHST